MIELHALLSEMPSRDLAMYLDVIRMEIDDIARRHPPDMRPTEVLSILEAAANRLRAHARAVRDGTRIPPDEHTTASPS